MRNYLRYESRSPWDRYECECIDEEFKSNMKSHTSQNERKSLEAMGLLYKNNNSSFHHKGACVPVCTRTRETPCDVLRLCGIQSQPFSLVDSASLDIVTNWARSGHETCPVATGRALLPSAAHNATRGHTVAHAASARVANISRANRYFRAEFQRKRHAGTIANLEKVLFVGPDVKRGVM